MVIIEAKAPIVYSRFNPSFPLTHTSTTCGWHICAVLYSNQLLFMRADFNDAHVSKGVYSGVAAQSGVILLLTPLSLF